MLGKNAVILRRMRSITENGRGEGLIERQRDKYPDGIDLVGYILIRDKFSSCRVNGEEIIAGLRCVFDFLRE